MALRFYDHFLHSMLNTEEVGEGSASADEHLPRILGKVPTRPCKPNSTAQGECLYSCPHSLFPAPAT